MNYKETITKKLEEIKDLEEGYAVIEYEIEGNKEFDYNLALSVLLADRIIYPNSQWWKEELSKEQKDVMCFFVDCSDVFAWGCSDGEVINFKDVKDLYLHYEKNKSWGSAVWTIKKRGVYPQKPVYEIIQKLGIWNLDDMDLNDGYDGKCK